MMGKEQGFQPSLFYTNFNIDRRVRKDHPLRKIKKLIDFDFIYQEVKGRYGHVSAPPPVILKLMLHGWPSVQSSARHNNPVDVAQLPLILSMGLACQRKEIMKKIVPFATILFLTFATTGCSLLQVKHKPEDSSISHVKKIDLSDSKSVKETLYLQHQQWQDTEYALGGLSKKNIDCSGFVYVTYLEKLGIELPRTTELQSHIGKEVQRSELRAADLVFFKTGPKLRHVGMYIENDTFLHVSKKEGVTISTLRDYYWGTTYWHARRVGD